MKHMLATCGLLAHILLTAAAHAEPPTIHSPADPPRVRSLDLREQWRIDPEDEDAPLLGWFDQRHVVVHAGRVYMLDAQLSHVLVYSDDGEHLDTIVREGDGPGEVRDPGALFLRADGSLAVQHGYPTKLEFVELDGTPRGRWRLEGMAWMTRARETPRGWYGVTSEMKESDDPGNFFTVFRAALHDDEGARTVVYHSEEIRRDLTHGGYGDEADEYEPWYKSVALDGGEIVLPPVRDEYRLEWRDPDGATTRVVTRDFKAHRRTQAELDEARYSSYSIVNGELIFPDRKLCSHEPMIRTLEVLPDGALRVRTSLFDKNLPPGMVCRFEIHEATGELRERVEIFDPTGDFDVDYDAVALLADGRAMVLRNLQPAFRVANDVRRHPDLVDKLPPIPDDREEIDFVPIMCGLVPRNGGG